MGGKVNIYFIVSVGLSIVTVTKLFISSSASGAILYQFVEKGQSIILPCESVVVGQSKCSGTTWIFYSAENPKETLEIITLGQNRHPVPEMSKRLRVTDSCGLEQGFPNFSGRDPQNSHETDSRPPLPN